MKFQRKAILTWILMARRGLQAETAKAHVELKRNEKTDCDSCRLGEGV